MSETFDSVSFITIVTLLMFLQGVFGKSMHDQCHTNAATFYERECESECGKYQRKKTKGSFALGDDDKVDFQRQSRFSMTK